MKNHFASALALGACIIFGCGIIAMGSGKDAGLIGAFIAIASGGWLLKQAWELSTKEGL